VTPQNIKQGDDFLKQIVPVIMASNACEYGGVIANANDTLGLVRTRHHTGQRRTKSRKSRAAQNLCGRRDFDE